MYLRATSVASLACTAVLVLMLGCAKRNVGKNDTKESVEKARGSTDSDTVSLPPIESLRADAKPDPSARQFLSHGPDPILATDIHRGYIEDFVLQPGAGIGRPGPTSPRSHWTELVSGPTGEQGRGGVRISNSVTGQGPVPEMRTLGDGTVVARRERVWLLTSRLLVSVNGARGPAVYLHAPERQSGFTKPKWNSATADKVRLDEFERDALNRLRAGHEVALRSDKDELRMLGAIRARQECLSCHDGGVGTLLGAFTYTLKLQSEETPEPQRLKKP